VKPTNAADKPSDFAFGKNWRRFIADLDEERIKIAESSLLEFMNLNSLQGKSFLDIGCGSGLFSLAAQRLGAGRVISFDLDPQCVECCRRLRKTAGDPPNWEVRQGSVLDADFLAGLGAFDIVYAWGVLHHTGKMWDAVENAAGLVGEGGCFYLALYNKILRRDGAAARIHDFWTNVKIFYNRHPTLATAVLELPAMAAYLAMVAAQGENPLKHIRMYKSHRGMSWRTDARDWLGGYPYEYATVEEVFSFVRRLGRGFNLVNLKVTSGRGLNWFLFERSAAQ
jgi:2-polyprenyl-6-hydroxyphenyl methylase/3-demethylubiquinone-9 3-methyltransferase